MELRDILRNLVTNKYMPGFDYVGYKISFNTVFYKTPLSYCCCTCAYDHEYLDYLSDDKAIDKEFYERVETSILCGECKHVANVPSEYIKETTIYGIHIAAAVQTTEALKRHRDQIINVNSGIFRLSPCAIAALKGTCKVFYMLKDRYPTYDSILARSHLYTRRLEQSTSEFEVKAANLLELATLKQNILLLQSILDLQFMPSGIATALRIVFSQNLLPLQEKLIDYIVGLANDNKIVSALFFAERAIVYNECTALDTIVKHIALKRPHGTINYWLEETCTLLQQKKCLNVISKYDNAVVSPRPVWQRLSKLLYLLDNFHETCKNEVVEAFLSDHECLAAFRNNKSQIHTYLNPNKKRIDISVLKTMFDLDLNIDSVDINGNTPITHILKVRKSRCMNYRNLRRILETLIHENPDVSLNDAAVTLGLNLDAEVKINVLEPLENDIPSIYIMDGSEHALMSYMSSAMMYFGPFLVECGFPVGKDLLIQALHNRKLPSDELVYFQNYLDEPRPLMLGCRDTLRKHFKGRKLHTFLEVQEIPRKIKDYILIQLV